MDIFFSVIIGYILGSISPAAYFSKKKNTDLREHGTGNLGATNTSVVLGKKYGVFVMLFDILKSFVSYKIVSLLFPTLSISGLLAGCSSILGHIFPFYMKFKGGKGLASLGGLILAVDPLLFLILLAAVLIVAIIFNYSASIPISASILFPILYGLRYNDLIAVLLLSLLGMLIIAVHIPNVKRAKRGEEKKVRTVLKELFTH